MKVACLGPIAWQHNARHCQTVAVAVQCVQYTYDHTHLQHLSISSGYYSAWCLFVAVGGRDISEYHQGARQTQVLRVTTFELHHTHFSVFKQNAKGMETLARTAFGGAKLASAS